MLYKGGKIRRILVANRGEIATRIVRTCESLGIESVLAVSAADRSSLPAKLATRSICIGPSAAHASYLKPNLLVQAALGTECDALHPGYGFLSEQPDLAELCSDNGLLFIGPNAETIRLLGNKLTARDIAKQCDVPLLFGSSRVASQFEARLEAEEIGFPILLKAASGGGGRGIKIVRTSDEIDLAFSTASAEANAAFGDPALYIEKYLEDARHIEVQVLGDSFGKIIHLGERDCTLQHQYQKVIEESPVTKIPKNTLKNIQAAALRISKKVEYLNAGTVEFLYDKRDGKFYFLEMNTRLQVEHPVTEMVTGIDIVEEQIRISQGENINISDASLVLNGHSIEARVTAVSPENNFNPSPGRITAWEVPDINGLRVDSYCETGSVISPFYDSLIAKLIVHSTTRLGAIEKLTHALGKFILEGIDNNKDFLQKVLEHHSFINQDHNTRTIDQIIGNSSNYQEHH